MPANTHEALRETLARVRDHRYASGATGAESFLGQHGADIEAALRDAERWRHVITRGRLPLRCSAGYYLEDGVIHPTPEAAIDAAIASAGADGEGA